MKNIDLSTLNVTTANELDFDRIIREKERELMTSVSRSEAFQLERQGLFPLRRKLAGRSVGWLQSELLEWIKTREPVVKAENDNTQEGAL